MSIVHADGVTVVIKAMRWHLPVTDIQHHGCFFIAMFAVFPDNKLLLANSGAINVVVEAMLEHRGKNFILIVTYSFFSLVIQLSLQPRQ